MKTIRIWWIESLRAIALLMVIIPHFIATFCPEVFNAWDTYSWALSGISGKHGVAIFFVLIGYFASRKCGTSIPTYTIRRYLQFSVNIAIVLIPLALFFAINNSTSLMGSLKDAFVEALFFRDNMVPTFWCVPQMFIGSLISFILGNYCRMENTWHNLILVIVVCASLYFFDVWISICILGAALRVFQEIPLQKKTKLVICIASACLIPLLYRHPESTKTYFMQGCSCALIFNICSVISQAKQQKHGRCVRGWILPLLGNISFYMFLWHTPINMILHSLHYENWNMWLLFSVSFSVSTVLSIIVYCMNNKWITPSLKKIQIDTI